MSSGLTEGSGPVAAPLEIGKQNPNVIKPLAQVTNASPKLEGTKNLTDVLQRLDNKSSSSSEQSKKNIELGKIPPFIEDSVDNTEPLSETNPNGKINLTDAKAVIMSYTGENSESDAVLQLLELVKRKFASHE